MESAPKSAPDAGETADPPGDAAESRLRQALLPAAQELLDSVEEKRKRALIRQRLFGPPSRPEEAAPTRIGRFVPLRRLGAGGMGVVYVAYDEQLHREVAVKLLRSAQAEARTPLLREARALAQVTHPNIVTIYEVGESNQRIFIAMELIAGVTLRDWLQARERTWSEIVAIFRQAGLGLWAVHQHGLVHRDFKPENVMIGDDGRVRIVDFGLARRAAASLPSASAASPESSSAIPADSQSQSSVGVAGTPLYMAPEQYAASPSADARSDQFGFCVALFEALYGSRPFAGSTPEELFFAMQSGEILEVSRAARARVPDWLHGVVLRGLQQQPEARFPSMAELLEELGRDRQVWRRRGKRLLGMGAVLALSLILGQPWRPKEPDRCAQGTQRIAEVWGAPEHAALRVLLQGAGSPAAQDLWRRSEALLDRYATGWSAMYGEACFAHKRREQSDELFDLRMRCLDQRRAQLQATVTVLRELSRPEDALDVVIGLEPLSGCADVTDLRAGLQLPEGADTRAAVVALRAALGRVEVEERAGRYPQALSQAQQIVQQSEVIGYEPLIAEALFQRGAQESRLSHYDLAAATLEQAFRRALSARHDQLAAQAANLLLYIRGHRQSMLAVGSAWEQVASALLQRRDNNHKLAIDFYGNRGLLRSAQGDHQAALADFDHALLAVEALYGKDHLKYARILGSAAQVHFGQRRYEAARAEQERALSIREGNVGRDHPIVASSLNALALTLLHLGELSTAEKQVRRALSIQERALSSQHPDVAATLRTLAEILLRQARPAEALQQIDRALTILQTRAPGSKLRIAAALLLRAQVAAHDERFGDSLADGQRALSLQTEVLGPQHPDRSDAQVLIGGALLRLGRSAEAKAAWQQALETRQASAGAQHSSLGPPLLGLGQLALLRNDPATGCALLQRAVELYGEANLSGESAEAQLWLAQALPRCGAPLDRVRQVRLLRLAMQGFQREGPVAVPRLRQLQAFAATAGLAAELQQDRKPSQ